MDFSDSDDEGQLIVDDQSQVDDSICPVCRGSTYVGETINCEKCSYWFHFECVGVTQNDACVQSEDEPFFCKKCGGKKNKKVIKKPPKSKKPKQPKKASSPKTTSKTIIAASPPIKLKISFGKKKTSSRSIELSPPRHSVSNSSKRRSLGEKISSSSIEDPESRDSSNSSKKRKRQKSEDEQEKEERWLDAVESGNLHVVDDELKSIKDPKAMTARQRAMVDKKNNDDYNDVDIGHMSLSYFCKKAKVEDEESQKIKAMKSEKRKQLEQEKREQDRIKTMERLLNKKESSTIRNTFKNTSSVTVNNAISVPKTPKITYIDHIDRGLSLTFPKGMEPKFSVPKAPPKAVKCAIESCNNIKKYNCSKTGQPLCSLSCYKRNLIS